MQSGVEIDDEVIEMYQKVKGRKEFGGCLLKLSDDRKKIVVDKENVVTLKSKRPYRKLMKGCKDDNCRFGFVNVKFRDEEKPTDKLLLVNWASDKAKINEKMVASSSFEALKLKCHEAKPLQMNDEDDKQIENVLKTICKGTAIEFEGAAVQKDKRKQYCFKEEQYTSDEGDD